MDYSSVSITTEKAQMNKADTSLTGNDHVEDIANLASHFVAVQNRQVKQDIRQKHHVGQSKAKQKETVWPSVKFSGAENDQKYN